MEKEKTEVSIAYEAFLKAFDEAREAQEMYIAKNQQANEAQLVACGKSVICRASYEDYLRKFIKIDNMKMH
jgi:hypothetical protein